MKKFWGTLNYSSCNEDGNAELRALEIRPGDTVCCITGGGDRPLHMLLADAEPSVVYAVDMNSAQNHLLELKMAAIREFDYDRFTRFLGLHEAPAADRFAWFAQLRPALSAPAAAWFDAHLRDLAQGILYAGRWERHFAMTSRNLRFQRGAKIDKLFSFKTAAEQAPFIRDEWDTLGWRLSIRLAFSRPVLRHIFGDPGFYAHSSRTMAPWRHIHTRLNAWLERYPARESFMLALVFKGRFFDPAHYPPYLREENFALLKSRLGRVKIRTAPLFDFIESDEGRACYRFSLSDVPSFLNEEAHARLFELLAVRKGMRFCIRDFLTRRMTPPASVLGRINFLNDLQDELAFADASLAYDFIIGEVPS